jgi:hypothetical protein
MSRGYTGWTYIADDDRVVDVIVRSCHNAMSQLLVTQHISIISKPVHNPSALIETTRFQRVGQPKVATVFSTISTEDTVINYIETKGRFNSQALNEFNEVATVTYNGDGNLINDLTIPIATLDGIYIVGDIIEW